MSALPVDPQIQIFAHRAARRASLWIAGRPARVLKADGEYVAQILELDGAGAILVAACVFSLGEVIVVTINGVGHVQARVVDRAYRGVHIAFEQEPELSRAVRRVLNVPAPEMIL